MLCCTAVFLIELFCKIVSYKWYQKSLQNQRRVKLSEVFWPRCCKFKPFFCGFQAIPFFFLVYRRTRFPILGRSVGRIETKNLKKKNHKKSRNSRPGYPRTTLKVNIHIFGLTKCTIYCEKCSCFCPCFSLCCSCAHFSD